MDPRELTSPPTEALLKLQNAIWESIKNHGKRRSAYFPFRPKTRSSFPDATLVCDRTPLLAPLRSDCHPPLIRNPIWLWFCFVFMTHESFCLNSYNELLHLCNQLLLFKLMPWRPSMLMGVLKLIPFPCGAIFYYVTTCLVHLNVEHLELLAFFLLWTMPLLAIGKCCLLVCEEIPKNLLDSRTPCLSSLVTCESAKWYNLLSSSVCTILSDHLYSVGSFVWSLSGLSVTWDFSTVLSSISLTYFSDLFIGLLPLL